MVLKDEALTPVYHDAVSKSILLRSRYAEQKPETAVGDSMKNYFGAKMQLILFVLIVCTDFQYSFNQKYDTCTKNTAFA